MLKDGTIKDFEIELNKRNMTPRDPLWTRLVADFLSQSQYQLPNKYERAGARAGLRANFPWWPGK